MTAPSVSVVIPVHDRKAYIGPAVASVLAQGEAVGEVIVVDDGSTDGSADVVAAIGDPRVRVLRLHPNQGQSAARNRGIEAAGGDLVGFLDSDDLAVPGRFLAQARRFRAEPDLVILAGTVETMDAEGRPIEAQGSALDDTEMRWFMLFNNPFPTSTVMVRRDTLRRHGLRFDTGKRLAEDYDLWSRLIRHGRGEVAGEVAARYRVHDGQTSRPAAIVRIAAEISAANLQAMGVGADVAAAAALRYIFNNLVHFSPVDRDPGLEIKNWRWFGNFLRVFEAFKQQPGLEPASLARIEAGLRDRMHAILLAQDPS
jgi:glycosyltransferase involved in cell wall biosynthesis